MYLSYNINCSHTSHYNTIKILLFTYQNIYDVLESYDKLVICDVSVYILNDLKPICMIYLTLTQGPHEYMWNRITHWTSGSISN